MFDESSIVPGAVTMETTEVMNESVICKFIVASTEIGNEAVGDGLYQSTRNVCGRGTVGDRWAAQPWGRLAHWDPQEARGGTTTEWVGICGIARRWTRVA